jgi:hypothetical protein
MMHPDMCAYVEEYRRPWQNEWIHVMMDRKDSEVFNTSACTGSGKSTVELFAPWITDGKRVAYIFTVSNYSNSSTGITLFRTTRGVSSTMRRRERSTVSLASTRRILSGKKSLCS